MKIAVFNMIPTLPYFFLPERVGVDRYGRPQPRRRFTYAPPKYPGQRTAYLVGAWRPMTDDDIAAHNKAARGEQA